MGDNDPKETYNRPPVFKDENYAYWKENMYVHLLSVDKNLWIAVTEGSFIPKRKVDDPIKYPKDWTDDETKKASYDLKVRYILISILSVKVLYSMSHHKSTKATWGTFETLYEGTEDVKDSKINMLT